MDSELLALMLALSEAHAALSEYFSPPDPDVLILARAIQGEEAGQFGDRREELGVWIAHVAYNRWEKDWWKTFDGLPCTFAKRVEHDWHGTANVSEDEVEEWALSIAQRVTEERHDPEPGPYPFRGSGALFAMTLDDLQDHGWTARAHDSLVDVVVSPVDERVQFWFMRDDPAKKGLEHNDHY